MYLASAHVQRCSPHTDSMAREYNIDPATNHAFAEKLKEHYDFLGISASIEAATIEEDGAFNDIDQLDALQTQKVFQSSFLV